MAVIGIYFLDAARFRENCFCVVFILGVFAPSSARVNLFSRLFLAAVGKACLSERSQPPDAGLAGKMGRRWPHRRTRHRHPAGQAGGKTTRAGGSSSVGEGVFVVGHRIHIVKRLGKGSVTDRNVLFARPHVLGAGRVRENWFLVTPGVRRTERERGN